MYNHAPEGYDCPFCRLAGGVDTKLSSQDDVVYRDNSVTAFISAGWWPHNPGHALIVPNEHHENIYDLPPELATPIQRVAREIAIAFKETYGAHGVSTRNHNEPDGMQDVWHYHLHVFPRYRSDNLYLHRRESSTPEERRPYADKLKEFLVRRTAQGG
ncbi:MAG: HIT domain-containing protein [Chloroflexia bacterium]|nr:HIT domain-containing protein [Chloroflexia bacterium]